MQSHIEDLKGNTIVATDGEVGKVDDFYFDDQSWTIRYLIASTGNWFAGKDVLLSPFAVTKADTPGEQINVNLTRKQIDSSPSIAADKPVSSQREASYYDYYGYPYYWNGPYLWGPTHYPQLPVADQELVLAQRAQREVVGDPHLRSAAKVTGYHIEATDGDIGHVEDFIVDTDTWEIRYIVVDTRNWWPGKKVLIAPRWIERMSWDDSKVYVNLSRESIRNGPEYDRGGLSREYEEKLHDYYDRPKYWDPSLNVGPGI